MNITYLLSLVAALVILIGGMAMGGPDGGFAFAQIFYFLDMPSVLITIGLSLCAVIASFPAKTVAALPKHLAIVLNTKLHNPSYFVDQLVELAQIARKNGLLALEEQANAQSDPFFKQAIMLIVDANDPDKVRNILVNDIDCMSARHDGAASMYEKCAALAPAMGMVGTLLALIKMLMQLDAGTGGSSAIGPSMSMALITTLYGCLLAHMICTPIAQNLRSRDEDEVLCKMIVVEGIMSIQSGENPKFLKEKLMTFMAQKQREASMGGGDSKKSRGRKK